LFNQRNINAFTSLYWLAKEEVANNKFNSLIKLLEIVGVTHMKHFNHSSAGSIREMFLSIGDVITEDLVQEINMADCFGLMIDEVTDIFLIEQLVCFSMLIELDTNNYTVNIYDSGMFFSQKCSHAILLSSHHRCPICCYASKFSYINP
jgi:hypothetical protein